MNRRGFLCLVGLAPVAAAASAMPVARLAPRVGRYPRLRIAPIDERTESLSQRVAAARARNVERFIHSPLLTERGDFSWRRGAR